MSQKLNNILKNKTIKFIDYYLPVFFFINSLKGSVLRAPEWEATILPSINIPNNGNPWILYLSTVSSCISVSTLTNFTSSTKSSANFLNIGATSYWLIIIMIVFGSV